MAAQGVNTATMHAIAQGAGVSVGTLYNHFKDREHVLGALFETRRRELAARLTEAHAAGGRAPFEERLRGIVRAVVEHFEAHPDFVRVAHEAEGLRSRPVSERGAAPTGVQVQNELEKLAAAGIRHGALRPGSSSVYASAFWGVLRGVLIRTHAAATRDAAKETDLVVELCLRGAAP